MWNSIKHANIVLCDLYGYHDYKESKYKITRIGSELVLFYRARPLGDLEKIASTTQKDLSTGIDFLISQVVRHQYTLKYPL